MPFKDRDWWLVRLGGIALSLSMAGIIGWILWQSPIIFPDPWGGDLGRLISNNTLLVGLCGLFFLQGIAVARSSVQARDRYNRRRAALQGDQGAIPVARITVHPENAPDVAESPLVLRWTASKAARWTLAPMVMFLSLLLLAVPVFTGAMLLSAPRNPPWASPDLGLLSILAPMALGVIVVECSVIGGMLLIRDIPTYFGRRFGLSVDPEGVLSVSETGRRRFLRWEEMRLLEVTTNDTRTSRTFRLYGPSSSIEWSLFSAGATYVPDGISAAEMETRSRSLLDLINARTGLVPRTFDKPSQQLSGKSSTIAAIGCIGALALATIGFIAGLIFIPVTSSHLLNLSLIATMIYAIVAFLGIVILGAVQKSPVSGQADSTLPWPEDASISYALIFGPTLPSRLMYALSGIIFCLDLIPAILCLLAASLLPSADAYPQIIGIFGPIASLIMLPLGLFGLAMLIGAFRGRITFVTADSTGLTAHRGRKTTFIAWNQVERISGEAFGGTITTYKVQGAFMTISWPAINARLPRPSADSVILPISPYGLANLVAVRTGKSLSISERANRLGEYQDAAS